MTVLARRRTGFARRVKSDFKALSQSPTHNFPEIRLGSPKANTDVLLFHYAIPVEGAGKRWAARSAITLSGRSILA
jgi:hypothetical protein